MKQRITSITSILRLALLSSLVIGAPLFADDFDHSNHHASAKLVRDVQDATKFFINVNNLPDGYEPMFGCVSGPDHGAMGIHYVNLGLVGDGQIELDKPEAGIYEPGGHSRRLLGVQSIVDAPRSRARPKNGAAAPAADAPAVQLVV